MINDEAPVNNEDYKSNPLVKAVMESRARVDARRAEDPGSSMTPEQAGGGTYGQHFAEQAGHIQDFGLEAGRYFTNVAPGSLLTMGGAVDEATGGFASDFYEGVMKWGIKRALDDGSDRFATSSEFIDGALDTLVGSHMKGN
jgi:hypothetical protein